MMTSSFSTDNKMFFCYFKSMFFRLPSFHSDETDLCPYLQYLSNLNCGSRTSPNQLIKDKINDESTARHVTRKPFLLLFNKIANSKENRPFGRST